ncbi:hypothetical protein BX659_101140 [Orenia metallireducens]|jgi:uncharacterized OB-fold protein|uniref:Uncharacterized protein n=1 Tax=Orenia metallireducens TaxID=1413210 RepID=A0A285FW34_9FIRM|nr:hypothetical protein [Orenia metallireducens]PRX35646.1 hypothetical protein BX659_101140 [Orenia metallireducens]SNY15522.1 hypothetical protein SAMN06265827_10350 [Orenia metallireducens]
MRSKVKCQDCGSVNYTIVEHCSNCSGDLKQKGGLKSRRLISSILLSLNFPFIV